MRKLIIFDLDGTLLYTLEDLCDALNYSSKLNGLREISLEETKKIIGSGIINLIKGLLKLNEVEEYQEDYFNKVMKDYEEYYSLHRLDKTKEYFGTTDTLIELQERGYTLACLSNKPDSDTQVVIEYYFFELFDYVLGKKDFFKIKPSPEGINYILKEMDFEAEDAYMVGDSINDVLAAREAHVKSIYASYGYQDLTDYDLKINDIKELLEIFN